MADSRERSTVFEQFRRRLFAVAYRMMSTRADADDIVQEVYRRWHPASPECTAVFDCADVKLQIASLAPIPLLR